MNLFAIITAVIPYAIDVVKHVETFFKGSKATGETKRQAAVALVGDAIDTLGVTSGVDTNSEATAVQTALGNMVDSIVAVFNATGVFSHKTTASPAAPAPAK